MFTLSFILLIILILLSNICFGQCPNNNKDSFVSSLRIMDSSFSLSTDKWASVAYEVEQDTFSEVHLKYLNKDTWTELGVSNKHGLSVLEGCIPPDSIILIEGISPGIQPKIIRQREIIH